MLQLLVALLTDLGLNKASSARENEDALLTEIKYQEQGALLPISMSRIGYRTVLGCFYLSSTVCSHAPRNSISELDQELIFCT